MGKITNICDFANITFHPVLPLDLVALDLPEYLRFPGYHPGNIQYVQIRLEMKDVIIIVTHQINVTQ